MPEDPTHSLPPADRPPPGSASPYPERIGRYAIVRVLGEGGMGLVFEAQQDNPRRRVALKVIRPTLLSAQLLRRFGYESEVLGRLQHPGIAQVYEAGTARDDRGHELPFFAMELVQGEPLTAYADRCGLGRRERLELIAKVSDAVAHAHQKGVIHRDLKPANILVDAAGQPKILDFGVARATDSDLQQTTIQTDIGQLVGTVPYMSPEQVAGDPAQLDTRSDVYALGVITYQLLAGRLPYDLRQKLLHEAVRFILEVEPDRLSTVDRTLRGDVETIVSRALEKDKNRRYPSAEAFASDVRRYLRHEPITARPPSTWYQLQKFSRRHRGLVAGVSAAFVLLVAGLLGTGYGLRQALVARDEAASNARRAQAINEFVVTTLSSGDPDTPGGSRQTTVLQAMRGAMQDIVGGRFRDDLETEAGLLSTIAKIIVHNGDPTQGEALCRRALQTRRRLHPGDHDDVAASLSELASVVYELGRPAQAESLATEAAEMSRRLHPGDHAGTANAMNTLAAALAGQGRLEPAEPIFQQVLGMRERLFPGDHPDVAESINNLAVVEEGLGHPQQAVPLYERALAMNRRLHQSDHPKVANALNNLANAVSGEGKTEQAEQLLREALAMRRRMYSDDHPDVAEALNSLGLLLHDVGRVAEAESLFVQALATYQRVYPDDHPDKAWTLSNLCNVLVDAKQPAAAEPYARQALAMRRNLYSGDHPEVAQSIFGLANLLRTLGRAREAEQLFREALAMHRRLYAGDHPDIAYTLRFLAATVQAAHRPADADTLYRESLHMNQRLHPGDHPTVALGLSSLASCVADEGRLAEAVELAERAAGMAARVLPEGHRNRVNCERTLDELRAKAERRPTASSGR